VSREKHRATQSGFTLIESMISIMVLMVGVLGLAAMLADGMAYMSMSEDDYIAQQKAAEAVESVFTARDIGQATWGTICNQGDTATCASGIFLTGSRPLCDPGPDAIIDTADDFSGANCAGNADSILIPNAAGNMNPPQRLALSNFKRTVTVTSVDDSSGNPIANLRQITVTITYSSGRFQNKTYTLNAYISNFS
jgi:Tfp pilus assembly protein PilV